MKFNKNNIFKVMNLSNDMINIFNDYAFTLDTYFSIQENKEKHKDLYNQYMILNEDIKRVMIKNGFDKK